MHMLNVLTWFYVLFVETRQESVNEWKLSKGYKLTNMSLRNENKKDNKNTHWEQFPHISALESALLESENYAIISVAQMEANVSQNLRY